MKPLPRTLQIVRSDSSAAGGDDVCVFSFFSLSLHLGLGISVFEGFRKLLVVMVNDQCLVNITRALAK